MKKFLIVFFLFAFCLGMTACDEEAAPTTPDTTTAEETTAPADETTAEATTAEATTADETTAEATTAEETTVEETTVEETTAEETTAEETTASPEAIIEEIKNPANFENVTIVMAGVENDGKFSYTMKFTDGNCRMEENGELIEFYEGEDAALIRSIFIDTSLALLNHADLFVPAENGFRYDGEITYEVDIIGVGLATIVATNNVVTLDMDGNMHTLSCHMVQSCEEGTVIVDVTFTYTDYGTTDITPAE